LDLLINGEPTITLPENLKDLIDYATEQGTPITQVMNGLIKSIFKFGLGRING
jgi:hypothetical protein